VIAALLLLASAPAAPCDEPQDQQTMNRCAHEDFLAADKALNAQWKLTVAEMKARDRELDRTSDREPGHYETLLAAQRAWLNYRDAQCMSEGFLFRGGTMAPLIVSSCKARLTEARTKELKDLVETGN
jgi:uncharacterized protein YecT (DUF1311 family)